MMVWIHDGAAWRRAVQLSFVGEVTFVADVTSDPDKGGLIIEHYGEPNLLVGSGDEAEELACCLVRYRDTSMVVYPELAGHQHGCPIVFAPGSHPPIRIDDDETAIAESRL